VQDFFSYLAERLANENDISDITWALCRSDSRFQEIFLGYCFGDSIKLEIDSIEREVSKDDSRPDFTITDVEDKKYILEVKIYDKNVHKEYKNKFKNDTRAFIANYTFSDKDTIYHHVGTWHEFIKHLEGKKLDNQLINGYIKYLKSVTNYFEGETMNLSNVYSLSTFVGAVREIIQSDGDGKKPKKDFAPNEGWIGYDVRYKKKNKNIHFYFGLYFWGKENTKENTGVFIQFYKDTAQGILTKLLNTKEGGDYYDLPEENSDGDKGTGDINVFLKESKFKKLQDEKIPFEDQKDILDKYYHEVLNLLE
jgi:hypothetical protein